MLADVGRRLQFLCGLLCMGMLKGMALSRKEEIIIGMPKHRSSLLNSWVLEGKFRYMDDIYPSDLSV